MHRIAVKSDADLLTGGYRHIGQLPTWHHTAYLRGHIHDYVESHPSIFDPRHSSREVSCRPSLARQVAGDVNVLRPYAGMTCPRFLRRRDQFHAA